ncbi:MAG: hypothetical protein GXY38_10275 [Planctomycetes bacterium]|jgi:hypothetical protein|nr:hypothetical protein [Planctomycetota bacterium]
MKRDPDIQRVEERMAPRVLSLDGFLGADHRPLEEILDADRRDVEQMGLSNQLIGRRLSELIDKTVAMLGRPLHVGNIKATYSEAMGRMPCPWADGRFPKGEIEILDESKGLRLLVTPSSGHMIEHHGFYEGRGSRYRVDPALAAELLGLTALP